MPLSQPPSDHVAEGPPAKARRLLLIPAIVCLLEGAALLALAIGALVATSDEKSGAVAQAVLLVVMAALLVWVAIGLVAARRWARGPVVASQLVVLLMAATWAGPSSALGWLIGVPALAALVTMLLPSVAAVLVDGSGARSQDSEDPDQLA